MQHRHTSVLGLGALLCTAGILTAGVAGCSGKDVSQLELSSSPVAQTGQLELALTAHGASGALYRLRQAQFQAFSSDPFGGSFAFLSSENDPLATSLEATLEIGNYVITLFGGWFLEKVQDGQVTRVQARLLSSESQEFSIAANEETTVKYRFETNGEIIEFGQGRLIVEIEVVEGSEPEPEPEFTLGDPLEIVDGFISADSNPHGINAALVAFTAPIGASIEVTRDTGEVCVRGSIAPVENEDFASQWGALVGFDFVNAAGEPEPFGLDGGRVAGFAFTVTGPDLPFMRLQALPGGADPTAVNFCRGFSALSGDSFEMPLESLNLSCWNGIPDPLVTMSLANIAWLMVSDIGIGHTFDVCISDLRPLLR